MYFYKIMKIALYANNNIISLVLVGYFSFISFLFQYTISRASRTWDRSYRLCRVYNHVRFSVDGQYKMDDVSQQFWLWISGKSVDGRKTTSRGVRVFRHVFLILSVCVWYQILDEELQKLEGRPARSSRSTRIKTDWSTASGWQWFSADWHGFFQNKRYVFWRNDR